ncbi:unnamed protein product [Merluccius merluccius]
MWRLGRQRHLKLKTHVRFFFWTVDIFSDNSYEVYTDIDEFNIDPVLPEPRLNCTGISGEQQWDPESCHAGPTVRFFGNTCSPSDAKCAGSLFLWITPGRPGRGALLPGQRRGLHTPGPGSWCPGSTDCGELRYEDVCERDLNPFNVMNQDAAGDRL